MEKVQVCDYVCRYLITTNLSSRVRHFYPAWNEPEKNTSEYFDVSFLSLVPAFSALTLLVGHQQEHPGADVVICVV